MRRSSVRFRQAAHSYPFDVSDRGMGLPHPHGSRFQAEPPLPARHGVAFGSWAMDTSERVTWVGCPVCGRAAAVGWLDAMPAEVDCPGVCLPRLKAVRAFADLRAANQG